MFLGCAGGRGGGVVWLVGCEVGLDDGEESDVEVGRGGRFSWRR